MKWFYLISVAGVVSLSATPYVFLREDSQAALQSRGGKVVVYSSYGAKVRSLDPATCTDTMSAVVQGNVFDGPYGYHFLKRPVEVIPVLAESMPQIDANGLVYTIHLKKGIRYCRNACFGAEPDGSPRTRTVRAEDFVLAFKRIADYHVTSPLALPFIEDKVAGLKDYRDKTQTYDRGDFRRYDLTLEGVQAVDEHTLRITLVKPFPQLIYVLAITSYAPIPREVIDYYLAGRDDGHGGREPLPLNQRSPMITDFRAAVGTGPYRLTKFVHGGDIVLERNPDFREEFYPSEGTPEDRAAGLLDDAGKPVPFVDVNYMKHVPEDNPAWNMFISGRTDVSGIPRQVYHMVIQPGAGLTDLLVQRGIRMVKYKDPAVYWLAFNMQDPVLGASKSLRQALCLSFNVEQYLEVLHNGRGVRAVNTVASALEEHKHLPVSPYARFDLEAAKAKLRQARGELEAAGVMKPGEEFPQLTVNLNGRDEEDRRTGEFIRYQFRQLGIPKPRIELNDWPTLQEKVENKQCQIYAMGWHADYPDPENFLQLYYGPNIKRRMNNTNYRNPRFDRLYRKAAVMQPCPQRTALYREMVEILNEDCPVILLTEPESLVLLHPWVRNFRPHPFGYGVFQYRRIDMQAREAALGK
jgi:ABC-type transport system substrate-binding protein